MNLRTAAEIIIHRLSGKTLPWPGRPTDDDREQNQYFFDSSGGMEVVKYLLKLDNEKAGVFLLCLDKTRLRYLFETWLEQEYGEKLLEEVSLPHEALEELRLHLSIRDEEMTAEPVYFLEVTT